MTSWAVFLAVGLGSYLFRLVPMAVGGRMGLSPAAERSVHHAGIAALTALIVTSTVHGGSDGDIWASVLAVGAGTVIAVRGGSMLRITLIGYMTFVIADWLLGRFMG